MTDEQLLAIGRRGLAHFRAGTADTEPEQLRVPVTNYTDPERFALEVDRIFKRLPLVLGFSSELPDPGSYRALVAADVPVLVVRDPSGTLRAFVNMCSHRGATIVDEGVGSARRFTCPYHAWTYDTTGALVGVLDARRVR